MAIERINIQTATFSLRAANIRGPQLRTLVDSLRRAGAAAPTPAPVAGPSPGPGAIQSPAERFPQIGGNTGAGAPAGFAPGGSDQMRALDTNGFMRLIMQLLERLLESIFQMFSGGAGEAGNGGGCNGASGGGAPGAGSAGGAGGSGPAVDPTKPPSTWLAGNDGGAQPVPPRADGGSCRPRARPGSDGKPSLAKRLLSGLGRTALRVAPLAVPGGALGMGAAQLASGACAPPRTGGPCPPSSQPRAGAGSLEDRIFEYLSSKLREVEGELEGAMQQQESGGAAGGDSRSAAAQRVQQLVQKRSQMVELLSNSLKTLHDNSMAVNRNIRT